MSGLIAGSAKWSAPRFRSLPIWAHLAIFALSIVIPLWCLLGSVVWHSVRGAQHENEQQTVVVARDVALALDRELAGLAGILAALATSPSLTDGDLRRFNAQALQVVPARGAIVMRDRAGQQIVNTLFPFGASLPVTTSAAVLAADACVFRTRSPCLSDLYTGTIDPHPYVLLDAPVIREGEVVFALSIAVRAQHLASLLAGHRLPPGWAVSILDRGDRIVARWPEHDRFVGSAGNAALRENAAADEGTVRGVNVAGISVWGAYVRVPSWGWRVAIGVPKAVLSAPMRQSVFWFGAVGLLAVGASVAAALFFGRRLAAPIQALGRAAEEVGAAPALHPTSIRELDQVAASLAAGEERLRLAQEAGGIGIWELSPHTGQAAVSTSQTRLYGLPAEAAPHGLGWNAWLARVHPDDCAAAATTARAAMASGEPYESEYRILRADTGEERWIRARGRMSINRGSPGGRRFVGVSIDITEAKLAEAAIVARAAEFRALFENSVIGETQADMATLRFVRVNRSFCEIVGYEEEELLGRMTVLDLTHADDRTAHETRFRKAMAEGRPYRAEKRLVHKDGGVRWVIVSMARLPNAPGQPARTVAAVQDITARRGAEERQAFLAREVDHRCKNVLAVVQAAIRLTPRQDAVAFASAIEGRVNALARAHTLLAQSRWRGAQLHTMVEGELAAFVGADDAGAQPRAHVAGPPLLVAADAAQPLAMALHELATNATKYGALSEPGGVVSVTWSIDRAQEELVLEWVETGGPPVPGLPLTRGFGSRVLDATLRQLGGTAALDWRPGGLACRLRVPLCHAELGVKAETSTVRLT